jgi:hypothetical protein
MLKARQTSLAEAVNGVSDIFLFLQYFKRFIQISVFPKVVELLVQ